MGMRPASVRDGVAAWLRREKLRADSMARAPWEAVWRNGL